jgi:hypothetical protein
MTDPVDLDALDQLHAAATKVGFVVEGDDLDTLTCGQCIVALHNAYPSIAAELRALRQERDTLRAEITASKGLLARIHGDGGHHTEKVGLAQSVADADAKVVAMCAELDTLRAEAARLREALEPFAARVKQYPPWMWTAMVEREKQGVVSGGFRVGGEEITHMPAMLLVDAESALTSTPTTAEWLAARDEQMKRIGAAEWLEANNERLDVLNRADVASEAARLRAGKGE